MKITFPVSHYDGYSIYYIKDDLSISAIDCHWHCCPAITPDEIDYLIRIKPLLLIKHSENSYEIAVVDRIYRELEDIIKPKLSFFQKLFRKLLWKSQQK